MTGSEADSTCSMTFCTSRKHSLPRSGSSSKNASTPKPLQPKGQKSPKWLKASDLGIDGAPLSTYTFDEVTYAF